MDGLDRLLAPRSVAVVGATDRPGSYAGHTLRNLRRAGFAGRVHGVHPARTQVLGVRCAPSLAELGEPVDAVVIATPAASVPGYLADAVRLGCGGAVVYAAGFAETGDAGTQQALRAAAAGMPVIGPNANGLVAVGARAALWGDAVELPASPGPIALVTQSGNLGVVALAHRRGLGLHTVVSLGNAAVVGAAQALDALARQPGVGAVALYLEDDGDGAGLAAALAECARRDVRVAVLKTGRSRAGRAAGAAHTAALAADQRVFAALLAEAGGVLAADPLDLLETARALAAGHRDPRGLAVLTGSGGDAALAADLAADAGVPLTGLQPGTVAAMRERLQAAATPGNPLDHTNQLWADHEGVAAVAAALADDPGVGHLIYVQDRPARLRPADAAEWAATLDGALAGARRAGCEPLLVATTPGQEPPGAVAGLRPALAAVAALRRPAPDPGRLEAIAAVAGQAGGSGDGRALAEHEAKDLLAGCGVPVPDRGVAADVSSAVEVARVVGLPAAVKLSAAGLLHKSDAWLLALDLRTEDAVAAAAAALLGRPDRPPGAVLLVERMVPAGVEVLVAARSDGVVPCLLLGVGGIWAEAVDDAVLLPLPADAERVLAGLGRLRAAPLLFGGRGSPPVAVERLAELAVAVGESLLRHRLALVECNPVIVGALDAVAVDAAVRTR